MLIDMTRSEGSLPRSLTDPKAAIDAAKLKALKEFFSIGKALRYSPDAHLAVVLDTIIVAYCVNDHFIYSHKAIKSDSHGDPMALVIDEKKPDLAVDHIQQLHLLVPDTSDLEGTLNYDRRAIIGRARQFLKGNVITLIANAGVKGVSTMTTEVTEQLTMEDGPYANSKMILLDPNFDSLIVTDQLHNLRGKTHVPVVLYLKKGEPPYPCVLIDFSESVVGLRSNDSQHTMPPMKQDDLVAIVINLGEAAKTYTIKGRIVRRSTNSCAIRLEELFKDHRPSRFGLLDAVELKAGLLNFGN
ncbi:MAG: PilZ domain-containing protein [Betaproteobacteria bacterium]|nr:PilZ domain-containing protein [Betaproteobacteria bacterium]